MALCLRKAGSKMTGQAALPHRNIQYAAKLEEYVEKIKICGEDRNSYSKTDHSATFMRIKTDYMGNDQLLPAYNETMRDYEKKSLFMQYNYYYNHKQKDA